MSILSSDINSTTNRFFAFVIAAILVPISAVSYFAVFDDSPSPSNSASSTNSSLSNRFTSENFPYQTFAAAQKKIGTKQLAFLPVYFSSKGMEYLIVCSEDQDTKQKISSFFSQKRKSERCSCDCSNIEQLIFENHPFSIDKDTFLKLKTFCKNKEVNFVNISNLI